MHGDRNRVDANEKRENGLTVTMQVRARKWESSAVAMAADVEASPLMGIFVQR